MSTIGTNNRPVSPMASCLALFGSVTVAVEILGILYFHQQKPALDNWVLAIGVFFWLGTTAGMVIAGVRSHIVAMFLGVISGAGLLPVILNCISQ